MACEAAMQNSCPEESPPNRTNCLSSGDSSVSTVSSTESTDEYDAATGADTARIVAEEAAAEGSTTAWSASVSPAACGLAELKRMELPELKQRAMAAGLAADIVDRVDGADNPRATLVAVLLQLGPPQTVYPQCDSSPSGSQGAAEAGGVPMTPVRPSALADRRHSLVGTNSNDSNDSNGTHVASSPTSDVGADEDQSQLPSTLMDFVDEQRREKAFLKQQFKHNQVLKDFQTRVHKAEAEPSTVVVFSPIRVMGKAQQEELGAVVGVSPCR